MCVLPFVGNVAATYLGLCLWSTPEGHSEGSLFGRLRPTLSNTSACRLWSCSEPSQASAGWPFCRGTENGGDSDPRGDWKVTVKQGPPAVWRETPLCVGMGTLRPLLEWRRLLGGRSLLPSGLGDAHTFQPCKGSPAVQLLPAVRKGQRVFFGNCTALALPARTLLLTLLRRSNGSTWPWRAMKEPADSCLKASHHQVDPLASAQSSQTTLIFASLPGGLFRSLTQRVWLVFPASGTDWHIQGPLIARWHQQTTSESPVSHQKVLRHYERPQLLLGANHPCAGIRGSGGNGFRRAEDPRHNLMSAFLQKCSFLYSVVMAVSVLPNRLVTP